MKDQFVPYKLAVKLKKLGFNEPALGCYIQNAYGSDSKRVHYFAGYIENVNIDIFISAPLWQQAFDWCLSSLEDNYRIEISKKGVNVCKFIFIHGVNAYNWAAVCLRASKSEALEALIEEIEDLKRKL